MMIASVFLCISVSLAAAQGGSGAYVVSMDQKHQTILGVGFEIQSDSIGSGNHGLPDEMSGVPHDLVESERLRFYEMAKGFRFVRLALGLFLRGTDAEQKQIAGRWPEQMTELKALQDKSEIDGFEVEYWSPLPYWKKHDSYVCMLGGSAIKSFNDSFLDQFSDAMVKDISILGAAGLRTSWWGLQNEPFACTGYSSCLYNASEYTATFLAVAPKIRHTFPDIKIHVSSADGPGHLTSTTKETLALVDGWSYHMVGAPSNDFMHRTVAVGESPVFSNEYEYLFGPATPDRFINTVQTVLNWFVFSDSPKFTWLHILKPTTNSESSGYGLGFWRPPSDTNFTRFANITAGHFDFNPNNWHSMAGFAKNLPWNSVRINVTEDITRTDQRIMAFITPATGTGGPLFSSYPSDKLGLVVTNRKSDLTFQYNITVSDSVSRTMSGWRYTPWEVIELGAQVFSAGSVTIETPPQTVEFWLEQ